MTYLWHPHARRVAIPTAPQGLSYTGGGKKLVWHTTEGSTADGAISAYRAAGVCPHFTIGVQGDNHQRVLIQHLPLNHAASALRHPGGPETNRANAIQVEIVGFARDSGAWPDRLYHYLHLLAQFAHRHWGVPMRTHVHWQHPHRLTGAEFVALEGHCGHMHVPENDHVDPGTAFHIGKVLQP